MTSHSSGRLSGTCGGAPAIGRPDVIRLFRRIVGGKRLLALDGPLVPAHLTSQIDLAIAGSDRCAGAEAHGALDVVRTETELVGRAIEGVHAQPQAGICARL